ncbi:S8 family serine peptidase [bacterium]|nr:S8 family serine peptidase [bacterium]
MKLPPHRPGEVLARLRSPLTKSDDSLCIVERFELPGQRGRGDLVRIQLPAGESTEHAIERLSQDQRLEYVTSNDLRKVAQSNDPQASQLWGLSKIGLDQAWQRTTGSREGAPIAVLDTGAQLDHPDLVANLWRNPGEIPGNGIDDDGNGVIDDVHGYDACLQTGDPSDDYGHGTHCAGTIGAVGNNGEGVVGVNWQTRLMPVKMMSKGEGTVADTIRALAYATKMGARITSNSYAGGYNEAERDAFASSPLLHICAAGNEGNDNDVSQYYPQDKPLGYPANYDLPNIIAVAATNERDRLASFSNYGQHNVDLAAPGVSILSTVPGSGYETKSGTSMATPHVAGVAGLILSLYPEASNEQIKTRLLANVDTLPGLRDKVATGGRLNAAAALREDDQAPAAPDLQVSQDGYHLHLQMQVADQDAYRYHVRNGNYQSSGPVTPELVVPAQVGANQVEVRIEDRVGNLGPARLVAIESGLQEVPLQWESDGLWGQLPDGRWTDSPQGPYANRANSSLTSQWFKTESAGQLRLQVQHRLEASSDYVYLEAQAKGGQTWTKLEEFTSYRENQSHQLELPAGEWRLRFRLVSDSSGVDDGFVMQPPSLVYKPS